jgi:hypothetical protein
VTWTREEARAALATVWPDLPQKIDALVGKADARILSSDELRKLFAEFAIDVLWLTQPHRRK